MRGSASPSMSFTISPCREGDDWTRLFAIVADAFGDIHPYLDYVFPDHALPAGKEAGGKRLLEAFKTDPHAVFYKATVTGSDEIVGVAKWLVFDGVVPERKGLTGKWWPSAEAKELANYVAGLHTAERWKAITTSGGHVVCTHLTLLRAPRATDGLISARLDGSRPGVSRQRNWQYAPPMGP